MSYEAIPFSHVKLMDGFWGPIQLTNRNVTLAHSLQMLEKYGYVRNFELAAAKKREGFSGLIFMDSDLYKVLEAASYTLAAFPSQELDQRIDTIISKVAAAQMEDGYLNTYFQINTPDKRFTNLRDAHEIYCFGHLVEAAVAHHEATMKRNLLIVAEKFADLLVKSFGEGTGQREGYCGHPEAELALMKLWRVTGREDYLNLAGYFLRHRGEKFFAKEHGTPMDKYEGGYWQDDVPITDHTTVKGHAVRAAYLMAGAVDYAGAVGDQAILRMANRVWRSCMDRNVYITGGIGPSAHNEGFTHDYDLPNESAYQETCASIAIVFWAHRMFLLTGKSEFADAMERALYNGALAGISTSGDRFFYVNPLASEGRHHRTEWYACACCPPNISRLIASLGGYAFAQNKDSLLINLFVNGKVDADHLKISMKTSYPFSGDVEIRCESDSNGSLLMALRKPSWCEAYSVAVNGIPVSTSVNKDGFLAVKREWKKGDLLSYKMAMPARWMQSHPAVRANRGHVAITRGPLVYCLEQVDNEAAITQVAADPSKKLDFDARSKSIKGLGWIATTASSGDLYSPFATPNQTSITAVPYYQWDNRQAGAMRVWIPTQVPPPILRGLEAEAVPSMSHVSSNCDPEGIRDGREPANSAETPARNCHFWPRKGTSDDWAQYEWNKPIHIARARLYWFDDTGRGECRVPASYRIVAKIRGQWQPVELLDSSYSVAKDRWIDLSFREIVTDALRIELVMQPGWSAGIHEWQVFGQ